MAGSPTLLLVCVAGIYVCYLAYGLLQESLYKKQEDGTKFQATAFVLLVQCIGNALVALLGMWLGAHVGLDRAGPVTKGDDHKAPTPLLQVLQHRDAMTTSAVYVFAMYTSNEALKYVSYPAQALAKSSKMIPVMIGRIVILGNRYEWYKYVFVGMVTLGVTLFQFADGGSKHKSSKHSSSADEGGEMWGVLLLLGSLALDGMSGPEQEKLDRVHKLTNSQQMLVSNVWAVVYMAMVALLLGQLDTSVSSMLCWYAAVGVPQVLLGLPLPLLPRTRRVALQHAESAALVRLMPYAYPFAPSARRPPFCSLCTWLAILTW